ncbi:glycine betaine/proline transport system permease protein [Nocardiopsis mwathae]|uniref:Glycine betaine/proline transport system permease protein n=1 Tax=Nocardiopsis mwathae TaxID=1472723 RepID=A0A7W9YL56_9ACTN|nr:ABC transporter permease subunit [Nocardiopsis mwathae]MBB6174082.1 glycine betaine/proline transport system permease protein [Nocardiopsis mwathae]
MATTTTPTTQPAGPDRPAGAEAPTWREWAANRWIQTGIVLLVLVIAGALPYVRAPFPEATGVWLDQNLNDLYSWVVSNRDTSPIFIYGFNYLSVGLGSSVVFIDDMLQALTWPGVVVLGAFAAWRAAGWRVMLVVLAAFAVFGFTGLWNQAMTTLALIITAVGLALIVGIPLGIAAGRSDRVQRALRPVLDFMQIMPAFAYLMPMLLLFGIGNPAAAVATTVYAIPPAVRITAMAIRNVDKGAIEAATSLGSTKWQILGKVQLPLAKRTILLGVNQTIMLAVSMVVIASVIGAGGLGDAIYQALSKINIGRALEAGLAIVMLAIAMDRVTGAVGHGAHTPQIPERLRWWVLGGGALATAAAAALQVERWPSEWRFHIAGPVNDFSNAFESAVGGVTSTLGAWLLEWVLGPLNSTLTGAPWWLVVLASGALGWIFGGRRVGITCGVAILGAGLLGQWDRSMDTLAQILVAAVIVLAIGVVIGVFMARHDLFAALLRPVLDAMQTLPPFVYLIPAVALFSAGKVPALAAAVVFALPPVIRLVNDGIRGVSQQTVEAAVSQGSTKWQLLTKVQLPLARSSLLLAVNQGIMMILSMVVIGALVGGGALGYGVVFGLKQNELGLGLTSGLAIVCLGIFLDRMTQGRRTNA